LAVGWRQPNSGMRATRSVLAVVTVCFLAGCAQTNALLDGTTTGALGGPTQTANAGAAPGQPPLPARRNAQEGGETTSGLLSALSDIDLSAPQVAPVSVTAEDTPVNVYVRLARQIRRCWLGQEEPRLPGYGFRAEAKPGDAGEAEIDIFKQVEGRKYGPHAFEVKISPRGSGALVRSTNRRLDDALVNTLRGDIARWTRGSSACAAPRENSA